MVMVVKASPSSARGQWNQNSIIIVNLISNKSNIIKWGMAQVGGDQINNMQRKFIM